MYSKTNLYREVEVKVITGAIADLELLLFTRFVVGEMWILI